MEDDEETSEVPDACCSSQCSTVIYCFLSGTHSYIDGTKDWKTMKKRLRFELPYTPLKVLRAEPIEEDIQDRYHERFQAPGTSTEEAEADRDENDDSRRSSLSHEGVTSDIGGVSEEGMERYLGGSVDTVNDPPNAPEYPPNVPEYNTTGSVNVEAADAHVAAQVHRLPDSDATQNDSLSNDDAAPLLANIH